MFVIEMTNLFSHSMAKFQSVIVVWSFIGFTAILDLKLGLVNSVIIIFLHQNFYFVYIFSVSSIS